MTAGCKLVQPTAPHGMAIGSLSREEEWRAIDLLKTNRVRPGRAGEQGPGARLSDLDLAEARLTWGAGHHERDDGHRAQAVSSQKVRLRRSDRLQGQPFQRT